MTHQSFSRRDFLKLLALLPASIAFEPLSKYASSLVNNTNHIIIIVFDAWSANNLALHGYPRLTMPNLEKFAQKSTVYHRHYSPGTFTVPGTASLLTGLSPWTHRAINLGGAIAKEHQQKQIFSALSSSHNSLAYAQNVYADQLLYQAGPFLKNHIPFGEYNQNNTISYDLPGLKNDAYLAFSSFEDGIFQHGKGRDGSLFLGPLARLLSLRKKLIVENSRGDDYAIGLPNCDEVFLLSDLIDGFIQALKQLSEPSLVYFHFHPPHDPYRPTHKFYSQFSKDSWTPPLKKVHPLAEEPQSFQQIKSSLNLYDAYLASWDEELARLFQFFEDSGLRQKSHIFITSDHGEMHERGLSGHSTPLMYEPLIHVPLIVSSPGQEQQTNIYSPTLSLDILPTIANLTGNSIPSWAEGQLLPALGGVENSARSLFSMDAKTNASFAPLKKYTLALTRDNYRLTQYQYPTYQQFEFYNLTEDPGETNNIYPQQPAKAKEMEAELLQKITEVNAKFEEKQ